MAVGTHLAIRTLHVIGMALLLGGATVAWLVVREDVADPLSVAVRYEWLFWGAVGVVVLSGVGNLGALGVPGPTTDWGRILLLKLLLVVAFVAGSLVRTLAVVRMDGAGRSAGSNGGDAVDTGGARGSRTAIRNWTRQAYALTGWLLLAIVVLGEVLAHG